MARHTKSAAEPLTPAQASYVLEQALADRKLSRADVDGYLSRMSDEIAEIQSRLARLRESGVEGVMSIRRKLGKKLRGGDPPFPKSEHAGGDPPFPRKRKKRVSAERKASMKLQGEYLGLLSAFSKKERVTYQALAKKDGREKAIAAMKKARGT